MRTRKIVFILISGRAGTGKSTLAEHFMTRLSGRWNQVTAFFTGFSYPIKRTATHIFGWDGEKDEKGRRLLQVIGDCGREYNENIWVEKAVNFVNTSSVFPPNFVIVDDWRYPNEASYIEEQKVYDVVKIRVNAPNRESLKGTREYDHPTETSLPVREDTYDYYYDFIVDNTTDYQNLYNQGNDIISFLEKQFILE